MIPPLYQILSDVITSSKHHDELTKYMNDNSLDEKIIESAVDANDYCEKNTTQAGTSSKIPNLCEIIDEDTKENHITIFIYFFPFVELIFF